MASSWFINNSTSLVATSSQSWSITDADQTGLALLGDFSISMWINLTSLPPTNDVLQLIVKDGAGGDRGFSIGYADAAGVLRLTTTFSANGTAVTTKTINSTLTISTWYHIGFIYDASEGTVDVYKNGASIGQMTSQVTSIYDTTAAFYIGTDGTNFFDGLMNDIRVWSRTISAGEMEDMYTDPSTVSNGASLQGWWFLDDTLDATKAHDNGANNNDLTNNGAATFSQELPYHVSTNADVAGTPADTFTTSSLVYTITEADVAGAPTDDGNVGYGWANQGKSTAGTITNQNKSF